MTPRKQPGVAFWATVVVVVVLLAYPLSFGPSCWWFTRPIALPESVSAYVEARRAPPLYQPIAWVAENGPSPIRFAINRWATIGTSHAIYVDSFGNGNGVVLWRELHD